MAVGGADEETFPFGCEKEGNEDVPTVLRPPPVE